MQIVLFERQIEIVLGIEGKMFWLKILIRNYMVKCTGNWS